MAKYRMRALMVEALQWFPDRPIEGVTVPVPGDGEPLGAGQPFMATPAGPMRVEPGDWIVTGPMGERYRVPSEVFAATFERVK
jgi:hypothetical protein